MVYFLHFSIYILWNSKSKTCLNISLFLDPNVTLYSHLAFCKKSSSEKYSEKFQRKKAREEKKKLNFDSFISERYNKLFTF